VLEPVPFRDAFKFWLRLGFISFGGPAGQIAIMQRELVEERKWIDSESFLHALNFCMLLPGPEAQQLATYCGWKMHGIRGGITAGTLFVLPSVFLLLILSYIYARFGSLPHFEAVLFGFKCVVVAIVVEAVIKIGKKSLKSRWHILVSILSFFAISYFQIPFPIIVLSALAIGLLVSYFGNKKKTTQNENSEQSAIVQKSPHSLRLIFVFIVLWVVPLSILLIAFGTDNLPVKTYFFFTQAAFVTFGGAYAVLAYVNQTVVSIGWITAAQSVDGLALAETTPGPLIMVLQFIGFMIGWNNPGEMNQLFAAILCALIATYVTFLPSFMFIFVGAKYLDKIRSNKTLSNSLSFVTAAVVGAILNLALIFGSAVVFSAPSTDIFAIVLSLSAFVALYFLKLDVLLIVVLGGLVGFLKFVVLGYFV
jgi:chromate transporter